MVVERTCVTDLTSSADVMLRGYFLDLLGWIFDVIAYVADWYHVGSGYTYAFKVCLETYFQVRVLVRSGLA